MSNRMNITNRITIILARVIRIIGMAFPPFSKINRIRLIMKATSKVRINVMKIRFIFDFFIIGM